MKKALVIFSVLVYLAGIYYLTQPDPVLPDLDQTVRSDEPGDTWQNPDQKAFYTFRDNRPEILGELTQKFSQGLVGNLTYRLNYRPEEAQELVRDQLRSYYLEEVIHPLRESMFINVWQPAVAPSLDEDQREAEQMSFGGIHYPVKVTLKPLASPAWARLLVWTAIFPAAYLVYESLKNAVRS